MQNTKITNDATPYVYACIFIVHILLLVHLVRACVSQSVSVSMCICVYVEKEYKSDADTAADAAVCCSNEYATKGRSTLYQVLSGGHEFHAKTRASS